MTLDEMKQTLQGLTPGQTAGISHETFADLFPPGEPDDLARTKCYEFAKANGCVIDNRPKEGMLWFVKQPA